MLKSIRDFFHQSGFIEVETPIRIRTPALENNIIAEISGEKYLRTSPEFHMKRMLRDGFERIYQVGPCFRSGESGRHHRPEFTLLEWYEIDTDYRGTLERTEQLIHYVADSVLGTLVCRFGDATIDLGSPWSQLSVNAAFEKFAGVDTATALKNNQFDFLLIDQVEPQLDRNTPFVLIDYPIELGALARQKAVNSDVAERWELYIGGLEIANAYSELIDPIEQRNRFLKSIEYRRQQKMPVYPVDEDFMEALQMGIPECSGCALGIDRLVMLFADATDINDVTAFH